MARIPDELIERIKAEVPVADLAREYGIELKPKGKDLFASCPWHEDSDPSFSVTPGKNLWNCLGGCGAAPSLARSFSAARRKLIFSQRMTSWMMSNDPSGLVTPARMTPRPPSCS